MTFCKYQNLFMNMTEEMQVENNSDSSQNSENTSANEGALSPVSFEQLQERITQLENELADTTKKFNETQDRMLRIAADADNTRKRLEKEKIDSRIYAITEFAKDFLPVIDTFDKSLATIEQLDLNLNSEDGKKIGSIVEGVQMISKVFYDTMKKHGVEKLPGKGSLFNPLHHNAVAKVTDSSLTQETILDEFIAGYKIGDRVLRTAMVRVGSPD